MSVIEAHSEVLIPGLGGEKCDFLQISNHLGLSALLPRAVHIYLTTVASAIPARSKTLKGKVNAGRPGAAETRAQALRMPRRSSADLPIMAAAGRGSRARASRACLLPPSPPRRRRRLRRQRRHGCWWQEAARSRRGRSLHGAGPR